MMSKMSSVRALEDELNNLVKKFGLDYRVIVRANRINGESLGEVDETNKIIYIYSKDEELIYKILLHEIIEIMQKPLINKYIRFINKLLEYIQEELNIEKDRTINNMVEKFICILGNFTGYIREG